MVKGSDGVSRVGIQVTHAAGSGLFIEFSNISQTDPPHDLHIIQPGYAANTTQVRAVYDNGTQVYAGVHFKF